MIEKALISLESLFEACFQARADIRCWQSFRARATRAGLQLVLDGMPHHDAACLFVRAVGSGTLRLAVDQFDGLEKLAGGGLLVNTSGDSRRQYWIPRAPRLHRLDAHGRILEDRDIEPTGICLREGRLELTYEIPAGATFDCSIWQIPSAVASGLRSIEAIEAQGYFLWGSHSIFTRPSDLYRHLVHGFIYEDRYEWPNRWRICSENDAHALYVVCAGLGRATGKGIYTLLKSQLLLAVLSRQDSDGGYRHGTWTAEMESHFRLHASAIHLFLDAYDELPDETLRDALDRAVSFAAQQIDRTGVGTWFLHDELEKSPASLDRGPFRWIPSTVLGKSPANMLVLNTHLDLLLAVHRFAALTENPDYLELIESARKAALGVIRLAPMSALYAALFRLIDLTVMPTLRAAALPLPLRVLKRLARGVVLPRLPDIKTRFPRLVMPNGYVDRALSIRNWSHRYLGINAMDLARAGSRFPENPEFANTAKNALRYALESGIAERWSEQTADQYSIGFLAEAFCRICALDEDLTWRAGLAKQLLALDRLKLGFPPSVLGGNGEATSWSRQAGCPSPEVTWIRVAMIQAPSGLECLVLNTSRDPIKPKWRVPPAADCTWVSCDGTPVTGTAMLDGHAWRLARLNVSVSAPPPGAGQTKPCENRARTIFKQPAP